MEAITSNEFLNSVLEAEAWKELSGKAAFTVEIRAEELINEVRGIK